MTSTLTPEQIADLWQPIETAPRDEIILIAHAATEANKAFPGQVFTVPIYRDETGAFIDLGTYKPEAGIRQGMWRATHWMPLPPPPKVLEDREQGGGHD